MTRPIDRLFGPNATRAKGSFAVLLAVACAALAGAAPAADITPAERDAVRGDEAARIRSIGKVYGAVVCIYGRMRGRGGGSGVLFDPDGFALTNYHVVRSAGRQGKAGLADGRLYDWKLYGIDPGGDLAIIRLTGKKRFPAALLGDSGTVRVGDWALAMGNPFLLAEDQKPTVTMGIVSGVGRFQHGRGGGRTLVYGNCIQIDSSINPGNSGGPLFDLAAKLIGINGRGSFEERGRVNVGVGYAISVDQAKNFIPDLLATKVCQHATLDATFADEDGKVVCDQVNENAAIAKAGMKQGDELVVFDGTRIRSANHYLNLISTLPAGWPVAVTLRRGARERTVWVRLRALPYNLPQPRRQPIRRVKIKKPDEKKPDGKKDDKDPAKTPRPTPRPVPRPAPVKPGKIANKDLNREQCRRLLQRWTAFQGGRKALQKVRALECEETVLEAGKAVGRQRVLRCPDGRFRVDVLEGYAGVPAGASWAFDGKASWRRLPGQKAPAQPKQAASDTFEVALARACAAFGQDKPLEAFKAAELEGTDKTQNRRAFRLRVEDKAGNKLLFWFSLLGKDGRLETRLLKAARDSSEKGADAAWTFSDYRSVSGLRLPHRRTRVRGLAERTTLDFVVASCKALDTVPAGAFQPPARAESKD